MTKFPTWRNTPFAKKFYRSRQWRGVRNMVWDRAHGLCERCAERGITKPADVVHHVVPLSVDNMDDQSVTLNPDNLVALCDDCHTAVHQELGIGALNGRKEEPRVGFDADGNVVTI